MRRSFGWCSSTATFSPQTSNNHCSRDVSPEPLPPTALAAATTQSTPNSMSTQINSDSESQSTPMERPSMLRRLSRIIMPGGGEHNTTSHYKKKNNKKGDALVFSRKIENEAAYEDPGTWKFRDLFTETDRLTNILEGVIFRMGIDFPDFAALVVGYLPLYAWKRDSDDLKIVTTHMDTMVTNSNFIFGAVQGSYLNPEVDHMVSIKIVDGIEFGVGVCNAENTKLIPKRDFMCENGGWGYYNYRSKREGYKPKYPPGFYMQSHRCEMEQQEGEIFVCDDVLTLAIAREGISQHLEPERGNGLWTVRYYKNGRKMEFEFKDVQGPLYLCLNYYFMNAVIKIISDYRAIKRSDCMVQYLHKQRKPVYSKQHF